MDLIEEEDNEIFEGEENPDLLNEAIATDEENAASNNDEKNDKKPVKAKRIIRNPRVLLTAELLKGPKGLGNLEKCFERVKFNGKGYEEEDLNVMLKTYEYWCHRMYPKFPFKDCIAKIEKLGSKGPIKTHLKKVRSGMIEDETVTALPDFNSDDENSEPAPSNSAQSTSQNIIADIPIELTEEQLETIRRNKEKAEKLRQERLRRIKEKASLNLPERNELSEPSGRLNAGVDGQHKDLSTESISEKQVSSENGCNDEKDPDHNVLQGNVVNRHLNSIDTESDEELKLNKKHSKKVFVDDEEIKEPLIKGSEEISIEIEEQKYEDSDRINDGIGKEEKLKDCGKDTVEQMEVDE